MKANYQTFDADGKPKDTGTFEEWWASPEKYKISYVSGSLNRTMYRHGDKQWITGDSAWVPLPESMVEQYLVHPLPEASNLQKQDFAHYDRKIGANMFRCFQPSSFSYDSAGPLGGAHIAENQYLSLGATPAYGVIPMACFDLKVPMVRVEIFEGGNLFALFNDVMQAKGHYLAEQIWVKNADLPIIHVSLTRLDFPAEIGDAEIAPPASANAVTKEQTAGLVYGRKIGGRDVEYPADARKKRVQGMIMLSATISKTGEIDDLQIISGPKALQQAAYDAVKTWKYTPYLLNGEPVAVETQVNVVYTLGQ